MFDIADKEKLIATIIAEVGYTDINLNIDNTTSYSSAKQQIEYAIDDKVNSAIRCIINHLYTNQEFEDDIGLNKV